MASRFSFYTKKAHRYLGVFIGIQFLLWTVGGFYFSWTEIREIRGEHLIREAEGLDQNARLVAPSEVIAGLREEGRLRSLSSFSLTGVLGKPYYRIGFENGSGAQETLLADALTGEPRQHFSAEEALEIANARLLNPSKVLATELLTTEDVGGHHEYRDKPLPAYAITYEEPSGLVVYVSKVTGGVESVRTTPWRVFDLFWLFHTLDLYGRDDINNWVLRIFSALGLVTLASGYVLFVITSPWLRKRRRSDAKPDQ